MKRMEITLLLIQRLKKRYYEEHEDIDNFDNNSIIDEEISEAPEASQQIVES